MKTILTLKLGSTRIPGVAGRASAAMSMDERTHGRDKRLPSLIIRRRHPVESGVALRLPSHPKWSFRPRVVIGEFQAFLPTGSCCARGRARSGDAAAPSDRPRRNWWGGNRLRRQFLKCLGVMVCLGWSAVFIPSAATAAEPGGTNLFGPVSASDIQISGVVIGDDGQPVAAAKMQFQGFINTSDGSQYGGLAGRFVEEPVVSDARGRFQLRCKSNVELIHAVVSAPGAAPRAMEFQPGRDYVIRMHEGVRVTGRLLATGRPTPGVLVRAAPTDRQHGVNFVSDPTVTDTNGGFSLPHLPSDMDLMLFTSMAPAPGQGVLPPKSFAAGNNHTTTNLGDLELQPSFQVAGRILLVDGKPVPAHTRVLLVRGGVPDVAWSLVDAEGHFEFPAVPAESVRVGQRLPGYKFSRRNQSLDPNSDYIVGRVDHALTNLTLELEPGEFRYTLNHEDAPAGTDPNPRDNRLRGVPAGP